MKWRLLSLFTLIEVLLRFQGYVLVPLLVATVAQVGVVAVLSGKTEHLLYELLRVARSFEEELDDGGEQLQLHLVEHVKGYLVR